MMHLPRMIIRRLTPEGVLYEIPATLGAEGDAPFPLADRGAAVEPAPVLEALWLDGRLEEGSSPEAFLLPWKSVYDLEEVELEALGLPPSAESHLDIELRTVGAFQSDDFGVRVKATHPRHGILPESSRKGPAFTIDAGLLLAPERLLGLFNAVDRAVEPDVTSRLKYIGDVKKAAKESDAKLDPFLTNEDILVAEGIGLEAEVISPDEVRIRPVLEGEGVDDVSFSPRPGRKTKAAYTKVDGSKRSRIVLGRDQRQAADQVLERAVIRGPDVPRFFSNPEAFVPETIDLSRFSRRVRGLVPRRYNSQPYVRAEKGGKDWFTISAGVELAAEVAELGPDTTDEGVGERPSADNGAWPHEGPTEGPEAPPPSISPEQYVEMCRQVIETDERFVRHGDAWIEIDPRTAEQYLRTWDAIDHEDGQLALPLDKAGYVLDVVSNLEELIYSETREEEVGELQFLREIPEYEVPERFGAKLMPHQLTGYNWMRFLRERRLGGLLADDMGLGKTVQVISFLAFLADSGQLTPTLIVLPSALIENWHSEIRRFCPSIQRVYHHIGSDRHKDPQLISRSQIVLTTYQTLRRDQLHMGQVDWQLVVSDEAQYVKNPTAQSTSVLKAMKAKMRLALTGTPVENGLSELWCIVDFVQPGKLGSQREFRDTFEKPIATTDDDSRRHEVACALQEQLTPHYVRRVKEHILDSLPRKEEEEIRVPLGDRQRSYYGEVVHLLREGETIPIAALQRLIQVCSHPELYKRSGAAPEDLLEECPKLVATLEILHRVRAAGEKALIYTHYKRMQAILQDLIQQRFERHVPIINGEVAGSRRLKVVRRFNEREGFAAMILAPQAAGVGLNITGANHVIHYTRLWNPAKENQATDRAHRLGQTRPVTVYYPIVEGEDFTSVEERLDELLDEKRELARNVVWPRSQLDVGSELQAFISGSDS